MDEAQYDIHQEHGHYVLKVNGRFYGSYDCFMEAVKDLEALREGKTDVA